MTKNTEVICEGCGKLLFSINCNKELTEKVDATCGACEKYKEIITEDDDFQSKLFSVGSEAAKLAGVIERIHKFHKSKDAELMLLRLREAYIISNHQR